MIKPHEAMKQPSDDAVLWRFMDFTKYVALLDTGKLHFTQAKKMEDNYEGQLPKAAIEAQRKHIDEFALSADAKAYIHERSKLPIEVLRETCYLSCWHQNIHESAAMWKLYLTSGEGVAVRTTFAAVKRAFATTTDDIFAAVVNYIDYTTESFRMDNHFIPILHKRKSFAHEAEVRFIWWGMQDKTYRDRFRGSPPSSPYPPGHLVSVSVAELVQDVFVSPTAGSWLRDLVESVTRKYEINCPVHKSNLYTDPVW